MREFAVLCGFVVFALVSRTNACDLEEFFNRKQVSIEENTGKAQIIMRASNRPLAKSPLAKIDPQGPFGVIFDFHDTYKGSNELDIKAMNDADFYRYRIFNVTFTEHPPTDCGKVAEVPTEYIVFCHLIDNELRALAVVKWDENTDQRVWTALGWAKWSEWSSCSVSCSSGIQQRVRQCDVDACPGHNVEQRHCNMFGCGTLVDPLALSDSRFFHPSKERWERVPDRPTAWRLNPNTYIWAPSAQLFGDEIGKFPKEFALFITMRIQNGSMGTIFSLRSRKSEDQYLALELSGSDLKLTRVSSAGTDGLRIPTPLADGSWHQIAIGVRETAIVQSYVDCKWLRNDVWKYDSFDIPPDSDLIIGYLFSGDIEQLVISKHPELVSVYCDKQITPISDPDVSYYSEKQQTSKKSREDERNNGAKTYLENDEI